MNGALPVGGSGPAGSNRLDELRQAAQQLEAVFLNQLFAAMRASVPDGGLVPRTEGETMFTAMLDERMAQATAERLHRGLGEALYRQLSSRVGDPGIE
jgi:flagellar protein FlgJ